MEGNTEPSLFEDSTNAYGTFWEHLVAMRSTLLKVLWTAIIGVALSLFFYTPILSWVLNPLSPTQNVLQNEIKYQQVVNFNNHALEYTIPHRNYTLTRQSPQISQIGPNVFEMPAGASLEYSFISGNSSLALLSPLEGMQTTLKICFWIGLAATSPFWLLFIGQFIYPALHHGERNLLRPFFVLSLLFFGMGACFAYFITIPLANKMLHAFNAEIGTNLWSFSKYVDYTFLLMLANGLAFEIALLLFFCVHIGFFDVDLMKSKRRHAIFSSFILGALLTPPDVFTQAMLAIPLIGLFELSLLYARFRKYRIG